MAMTPKHFLDEIAGQLASELTANNAILRFTDNSALIGAHAEATVRRLIRRMVRPLRVSHGSIIYEDICPQDVPQLDVVIWTPEPVPPAFQVGGFVLVPRMSAMAFMEVKSSAYGGVGKKMTERLAREDELVPPLGIPVHGPLPRALGVVCLRGHNQYDKALDELIGAGKAVVLVRRANDGSLEPDIAAMYALINFLVGVRARARAIAGQMVIPYPAVAQLAPVVPSAPSAPSPSQRRRIGKTDSNAKKK